MADLHNCRWRNIVLVNMWISTSVGEYVNIYQLVNMWISTSVGKYANMTVGYRLTIYILRMTRLGQIGCNGQPPSHITNTWKKKQNAKLKEEKNNDQMKIRLKLELAMVASIWSVCRTLQWNAVWIIPIAFTQIYNRPRRFCLKVPQILLFQIFHSKYSIYLFQYLEKFRINFHF